MARGTTLIRMLDDYRSEIRASPNPAHNVQVRDMQVKLLQRTQERLWDDFNWPHLRVRREVLLAAGQRYYDTPDDMLIERVEKIEVFANGIWRPLRANVEPYHLDAYNSDLDERSYPPMRWQIAEGLDHAGEQVEIWPISNINGDATTREGVMRFTGIRSLKPLVEDNDRADLDDRVIVLYAAAETLAASGAKDAKLKLDQANAILMRKRAGMMPRRNFQMFGVGRIPVLRKPRIGHYRSLWSND